MYGNVEVAGHTRVSLGDATVSETEVSGEIRQLFEGVESLQKAVLTLCERLGPVQRVGVPVSEGKPPATPPQQALCPVASQIRDIRERVYGLESILHLNRNQLEI